MATTAVIIGGDAAGMSAASKIKRELEDAHVIVFEKTETISYSACGMPYWIGGVKTLAEEPSYGIPSTHSSNTLAIWGLITTTVKRKGINWSACP